MERLALPRPNRQPAASAGIVLPVLLLTPQQFVLAAYAGFPMAFLQWN
jgi:hypothetical protein